MKNQPVAESAKPVKRHRARKIILWTAGVLLVVLAALVLLRDILIENAIRKFGTMVVGTQVDIGSFESSLFSGTVRIKDLTVANPPGFEAPNALAIGYLSVQVDLGTLTSQRILVKEVDIRQLSVNFEATLTGHTNLTDLQDNVERFSAANAQEANEEKAAAPENTSKTAQKEVVIRILRMEQSDVSFSSNLIATTATLPLPAVQLNDIGEGQSLGETINELFARLLLTIADVLKSGGLSVENFKQFGDTLKKGGQNVLGTVSDAGKSVGEGLKTAGTEVVKGVNTGADTVVKGVKEGTDTVVKGADDVVKGIKNLF